ncbi:MAG: alpha/beta fold hydrolase [Bacillota bacterium]
MLLIKLLALYNFAFGLFHLFFWRILKWNEQLQKVSPTNRAVVQTLNICLTFMFFLVVYFFYFFAMEMKNHIKDIDRATTAIKNVKVEVMPRTGHMMSTEYPEFVNKQIISFII